MNTEKRAGSDNRPVAEDIATGTTNADVSGLPDLESLVASMTTEEKLAMLSGADLWHTVAIPRVGIPSIMMADGPHGLRKQVDSLDQLGLTGCVAATCFPTAVTLASSWDRNLLASVGRAIAEEARAEGVSVVLGPGINIKRSPLCGRNFEYFSEDPFLTGQLAAAWIDGLQSLGVGASLKHFAANNQESYRLVNNSVVDIRTLHEVYLAAFETAVKLSRPWTVMSSYNRLNGPYVGESAWLLGAELRGSWGFDGVVVSDWGAVNDRPAGVSAGLDLEMPGNRGQSLPLLRRALSAGTLEMADVDASVARIIKLVHRAGLATNVVGAGWQDRHHALACTAAEQSAVLLVNKHEALPLSTDDRVLVVGPFAKTPRYQGTGSSRITPTRVDSAYDHLCMLTGTRLPYAEGFSIESPAGTASGARHEADSLIATAVAVAADADAVVVFAGLPSTIESEGFDRDNLKLPDDQNRLISALAEALDRPAGPAGTSAQATDGRKRRLIIVLSNGAPVEMPWAGEVDAILEGYLAGQAGGQALARLVYGLANPSGKLAETFPLRLEDSPSYAYFPGTRDNVEYREGLYVGYRYYDSAGVDVLFTFGHGLSYTTFRYDHLHMEPPLAEGQPLDIDPGTDASGGHPAVLDVHCTVTNTGVRAGAEVVQLYVHDIESSVYRPGQELKAFGKVWLEPGQSAQVRFTLDARAFAFRDTVSSSWQVEPGVFELRIGSSSRDIRLRERVVLSSSRWTDRVARHGVAMAPGDTVPAYRRAQVAGQHHVSDADFVLLLGNALSGGVPGKLWGDTKRSDAQGKLTGGALQGKVSEGLPAPMPDRPFHMNTPMGLLRSNWIGALLVAAVAGSLRRDLERHGDAATAAMVNRSLEEMPVRSLVLMGNGKIGYVGLHALLELMNGHPLRALVHLVAGS